jgi:hypothetical protein
MNERQFTQIIKNVGEVDVADMEKLTNYWFGSEINPDHILKVANFNKAKKVYTAKSSLKEPALAKELMHSFDDAFNNKYFQSSTEEIKYNKKT